MKAKGPEMLLELDGPDLHPATVEPLFFLQLAEAWLRLTAKVGGTAGLRLCGLSVRDKCIALATHTNNARTAQAVAGRVARIVAGTEDPPVGSDAAADELRRHLRMMPQTYRAAVRIGDWGRPLIAQVPTGPLDRWERTEMRVQPIRVGGTSGGVITAKLASVSEKVSFTVDVPTEAHARTLGANLFRDIDVDLRIRRGEDDAIRGGSVIEVHVLDDGDPISTWRTWFNENTDGWEDVDNVLEALGRGH
jgi:hypothetical protein